MAGGIRALQDSFTLKSPCPLRQWALAVRRKRRLFGLLFAGAGIPNMLGMPASTLAQIHLRTYWSILLLKHSLFQRIILAKNVVFARIHAISWRLPPSRQQSNFKVKLL